jgi:hypothetical protein
MKKINSRLVLVIGMAVSTLAITSCKKKGCTDENATNYNEKAKKDDNSCEYSSSPETGQSSYTLENVNVNGIDYVKVTGTINESITFSAADKYLLSGGVFVDNDAVLTIQAGTIIYAADDNTTPFLAIQRGAKISAVGTENSPIVFTSIKSNPQSGDWGGIIINGRAPVNNGVDPIGEGQTGVYGGTAVSDNSGIMSYVRLEYAGKQLTADNELNGFSFNGVGNGTTLNNLQAFKCADDGFEFFGGTVNLTNALSYGAGDDSFDWTYGWSGAGTNWEAIQDVGTGDRGIEGDNNGSNNEASPYSNPTLDNIRLVGNTAAAGKTGIKLREGMKATITNVSIEEFEKGIEVEHDVTLDHVVSGALTASGISVVNVTTVVNFKSSNSANPTLESSAASSGNVVVDSTANVSSAWKSGTWIRSL